MDASQNIPENRQGDLDMLRSMAGSVGSDSTLSEQLAAVNQPSGSHPVLSAMLSRPGPAGSAVEAGVSSGSGQRNPFHVDTAQLRAVPLSQQEAELQDLGLTVYNQQEFETDIMNQVDRAMAEEEQERYSKILQTNMKSVQEDIRTTTQELTRIDKVLKSFSPLVTATNKEARNKLEAVKRQQENKLKQLRKLKAKEKSLRNKLHEGTDAETPNQTVEGESQQGNSLREALGLSSRNETEAERMIRMGEMTPFGTVMTRTESNNKPHTASKPSSSNQISAFEQYLMDQQNKSVRHNNTKKGKKRKSDSSFKISDLKEEAARGQSPERRARLEKAKLATELETDASPAKSKKKRLSNRFDEKDQKQYHQAKERDFSGYKQRNRRFRLNYEWRGDPDKSDYSEDEEGFDQNDEEWKPGKEDYLNEEEESYGKAGIPQTKKGKGKRSTPAQSDDSDEDFDIGKIKAEFGVKQPRATGGSGGAGTSRVKDDGNEKSYKARLENLKQERLRKMQRRIMKQGEPDAELSDSSDSDADQDMEFEGGFRVPGNIWKKLYRYQKTGVKWLWELHVQQAGGIVGDEMGLGKTIQMIAFLSGLRHSNLRDKGANTRYQGLGPTLIACPTTVMHQWVREFHQWAPLFRVGILHSSGSHSSSPEALIRSMVRSNGVLVTSYSTMVNHQETLLDHDWHYIILDEGHKIRNPDAQVTLAAKQFRTCHRIILSGSPVQNNLKELWSLLDFVFPGKLGTLPDFMAHFSVPIVQGGYANATEIQVQTAYKCSCVLRDTINPYLLRRLKADVQTNLQLPNKNEQVLFCRLTEEQKDVYQEYLDSKECQMILSGNYMVFPGLITLRKICNHPDLSTGGPNQLDPDFKAGSEESEYGYAQRSGKMIVVDSLLKLWQKQQHRVLLFTQSTQMLDILERFVKGRDYKYMRMDGGTSIASRQPMISKFNSDKSYFLFLLTTRVGGLGVNLTGADRVVIFDPDWNPSTDLQARERAWRIGQKRQVTIYRLLTTGSIEEKIYHRQIFKQFLTNRVLKDPKQRRFFKSNDLFELFTLGDDDRKRSTETSAIFAGTGSDVKIKRKHDNRDERSTTDDVAKRRNRFDEMRERELREETDSAEVRDEDGEKKPKVKIVEDEGDGDLGLTPEKYRELRELARKLAKIGYHDKEKGSQTVGAGGHEKGSDGSEKNDVDDTTEDIKAKDVEEGPGKPQRTSSSSERDQQSDSKQTGKNNGEKEKRKGGKKGHKKKDKEKRTRKEKHKKKRKPKDSMMDGETIKHLDRSEVQKIEDDLEQEAESSKQDDYVLQCLLKKSGQVHSAMQHDKIMMSSNPDYALVEAEAERVARDAAKALKESRARCFGARSGVPTWTGASGVGGAPPPRFGQKKNSQLVHSDGLKHSDAVKKSLEKKPETPKLFDGSVAGNSRTNLLSVTASAPNAMTSSQLFARMRSRNTAAACGGSESEEDEEGMSAYRPRRPSIIGKEDLELVTDIRNYVAYQAHMDGRASTQELLDEFKNKIPSNESAKFKAMVKQICDYDKVNGVGMWFLKQEFK